MVKVWLISKINTCLLLTSYIKSCLLKVLIIFVLIISMFYDNTLPIVLFHYSKSRFDSRLVLQRTATRLVDGRRWRACWMVTATRTETKEKGERAPLIGKRQSRFTMTGLAGQNTLQRRSMVSLDCNSNSLLSAARGFNNDECLSVSIDPLTSRSRSMDDHHYRFIF